MVSRALQARRQFPQAVHDEGGMGLTSRHEILFHAQMDFQRPSFKPAPAARSEV
jgi:hypothetical protein